MNLALGDVLTIGAIQAISTGVIAVFTKSWIESYFKHRNDRRLEDVRSGIRMREQAARVSRLLSLGLSHQSNVQELNELAWELTIWLPKELVIEISRCLCGAAGAMTPKEILIAVRTRLRGEDDGLQPDQIIHWNG
jgi:hypothetical protein